MLSKSPTLHGYTTPPDMVGVILPPPAEDSLELIAQALVGIRTDLTAIRREMEIMRAKQERRV
jgi:hypothetical protein